jgi:multidrug efflux pump subunit AcrA (membrane-fusion protein)
MSHNTRASRHSQENRDDEEEIGHTSSCSSAEGARRLALQDAKDQRSEERRLGRQINANQMSQEEADALDAAQASSDEAQAAADEADQAELDQEREDAAFAKRLADEEEFTSSRRDTIRSNRETANREAGTGQYLPQNILLQPNNNDSTSNSATPTNVEVDEFSDNISLDDHVARANAFLKKGNIDRRIITTVIVLKDSPSDLIIGRETIKKLRLIDSLPSYFKESTNLNVLKNTQESFADNSTKTRKVSFGDDYSEELFGYKPKN